MKMNKKRELMISDVDKDILMALYRFPWMRSEQISVVVGENERYVKGRLKQMREAGVIGWSQMRSNETTLNWITRHESH